MAQANTRRNFLKYSTLASLGMAVNPFAANANATNERWQAQLHQTKAATCFVAANYRRALPASSARRIVLGK